MIFDKKMWSDGLPFSGTDYESIFDPFEIKYGLFGGDGDGDSGGDDTSVDDVGSEEDPGPSEEESTVGDDSDDDSTGIGGGGFGDSDPDPNDGAEEDESTVGDDPSGAGDDGVGPDDGPGDGTTNEPDGNVFGIDGVSKTGSTTLDAAIGFTNGIGTGQIGNNFSSLNAASESAVNDAITMAQNGATVSQIGDMLGSVAGSESVAESTTSDIATGGRSLRGYTATGTPVYSTTGRSTTAPDAISGFVSATSGNVIGSGATGFSNVTDSLRDDDFSGLMSGRTDATGVQGYDNASKAPDAGMTYGPMGFGPPDLDPFGGRGPSVSSLTDIDNTGFSDDPQGPSFGGALFGGSIVETDKKDLDVATIAPGYGRDFGMNLASFMNTPNLAGITPTEAMSKDTFSPYSDFSAKIGGQAPTYGVSLADYSFNRDGTVTGRFSGQNQGFFSSPIAGVFSAMMPTSIAPAFQMARVGGGLIDASRKGTFSTVSNMLGLVNPNIGGITSAINFGAQALGKDVDAMLGVGANQGYMSQGSPDVTGTDSDSGSDAPVSKAITTESSTNQIRDIDRPSTTPTDLIRRTKRRAGEDVYGVAGSSPFLYYSDEIDPSGIGSFTGSGRSGKFKQAPTGR